MTAGQGWSGLRRQVTSLLVMSLVSARQHDPFVYTELKNFVIRWLQVLLSAPK